MEEERRGEGTREKELELLVGPPHKKSKSWRKRTGANFISHLFLSCMNNIFEGSSLKQGHKNAFTIYETVLFFFRVSSCEKRAEKIIGHSPPKSLYSPPPLLSPSNDLKRNVSDRKDPCSIPTLRSKRLTPSYKSYRVTGPLGTLRHFTEN